MALNPSAANTLGENIRFLRRARGLSQEELANQLGVSRQAVSLWEQDSTQPSLDNLRAMTAVLKTDFNALLGKAPMSDTDDGQIHVSAVPPTLPQDREPTPPPTPTPSPARDDSPEMVQRRMLEQRIDRCAARAVFFFLVPFFLICTLILIDAASQTFGFPVSDNAGGLMSLLAMIGSIAAIVLGIRQCRRKSRAKKHLQALPIDTQAYPSRPFEASDGRSSPAPLGIASYRGRTLEQFFFLFACGLSAMSVVGTSLDVIGSVRGNYFSFISLLSGSALPIAAYTCLLVCRLILALRNRRTGHSVTLHGSNVPRCHRFTVVLDIISVTLLAASYILRLSVMSYNGGLTCALAAYGCALLADLTLLLGVALRRRKP